MFRKDTAHIVMIICTYNIEDLHDVLYLSESIFQL